MIKRFFFLFFRFRFGAGFLGMVKGFMLKLRSFVLVIVVVTSLYKVYFFLLQKKGAEKEEE